MRFRNQRLVHISSVLSVGVIVYSLASAGCGVHNTTSAKPAADQSAAAVEYPSRFPIARNGKIGFIDIAGREVINAQFEEARQFQEGLGAVRKGAKWGFVDPNGKLVISYQFEQTGAFSEEMAPVLINHKWGYVNHAGKLIITPQFDFAQPFKNTLAAVKLAGRWGFINKTGKLQINPQFEFADHSQENLASLAFNDNLCCVPESDSQQGNDEGRFGYIDPNGKWVITPQFDAASDFAEKLAPTESGDRWGYIDRLGKFQINPQFDYANSLSDGLGLVKLGDRYGFIDASGQYVVNPQYDDAKPFSEKLAAVVSGSKWGYIDVRGTYAINPQFEEAQSFDNGLAIVRIKSKYGYVDHDGKFVWGPQSVASLYKSPPKAAPVSSATPASPNEAPAPMQQSSVSSDQLMPESAYRLLNSSDLEGKTDWQLTLIRNEIFARHGLIFNRSQLKEYFLRKTWYRPLSPNANAVMDAMSAVEKQNAIFVRNYQAGRR